MVPMTKAERHLDGNFTVLVFRLASSPFIFTKVVKVLIKHWRSMGFVFLILSMTFLEGLILILDTTRVSAIVIYEASK